MEAETSIWNLSGPEVWAIWHPVPYIWWAGMFIGFSYGLYRYLRSFKYLYYYYIEHGSVPFNLDGTHRNNEMLEVIKKHKLYEYFTPHGYVSGLGIMAMCTGFGMLMGGLYPVTITVGILAIPNLLLRWLAKEKRAKAVFKQTLEGAKSE